MKSAVVNQMQSSNTSVLCDVEYAYVTMHCRLMFRDIITGMILILDIDEEN